MEETKSRAKSRVFWFKTLVLILSLNFVWAVIIDESFLEESFYTAIPFTILTIYVWNRLNKNTDNK